MTDIYQYLDDHDIRYERHDHPPVFTVEDVNWLVPPLPAAKTKNLFLRDGKGKRHFLVIVGAEKSVDLKALKGVLDASRLSFGSPERLMKYLGITPGSVSVFAIVNDTDKAVEVVLDESLWKSDAFQFHPLINTSTLVISQDNLGRFLEATGHKVRILDIQARE
ncbi:MAG: aminoacyl-tRNA deacylase [Desulfobacteraceae bacterium 4572_88]|nr:MAG: aminoacyl-tRNA deacylase [Desulfobacteraceae bacterium 4572_88]